MMEKWNIIREILTHQRDTAILLYSGNHYTAVVIEDTQDRPEKRLRMTKPQQEDPPTQRERPAKVRRRKRKREDDNEAGLASATAKIKIDIFVPTQRRERPEWRRSVFRLYGTRSLLLH